MQLVAYGAQDIYLTGNPQITFFKVVYRRHTNFSIEAVEQTFNGNADFGMKNVVCQIARVGDLVTKMYLKAELSAGTATAGEWAWVQNVGHAMISEVELEIGGTRIDRQYGEWMSIWRSLARNPQADRGYNQMVGNTSALTSLNATHAAHELFVPLQFFCCRNDGLALPLIALQYHDVRVNFSFRSLAECVNQTSNCVLPSLKVNSASLLVDYVYLDSEERKRFAQASHEYLIETLQYTGAESVTGTSAKPRLGMNHPNKALFWVTTSGKYNNGNTFLGLTLESAAKRFALGYATSASGVLTTASAAGALEADEALVCSSTDATVLAAFASLSPRLRSSSSSAAATVANIEVDLDDVDSSDFSLLASEFTGRTSDTANEGHSNFDVVVYQHDNFGVNLDGSGNPTANAQLQLNGHDRFSRQTGSYFNYVQPFQHFSNTPADGVNVYSFALNPEDHQPSGTCNMSRIDNATLSVNYSAAPADGTKLAVYGLAYNVLRIMSGMGGLAYSN
jgi:hypothetical protein